MSYAITTITTTTTATTTTMKIAHEVLVHKEQYMKMDQLCANSIFELSKGCTEMHAYWTDLPLSALESTVCNKAVVLFPVSRRIGLGRRDVYEPSAVFRH